MISPFNDEQAQAIQMRDVSILVSAPAGSGKTKILVSRIMSLLMEDLYHVDQFLVLTFTQAAAAEMKQRLLMAIDDELKKDLSKEMFNHLLKQKEKMPYAYITNFHGFCSQLLKQYGYLVDIEPGFDILSETNIVKHEVLDECIEQWCEEGKFTRLMSFYFNDMHFNNFKSILLELYEVMHSIDNIHQFISDIKTNIYYDYINSDKELTEWVMFDEIKRQLKNALITGYNHFVELEEFASTAGINDFFERPEEQTKKNMELPVPYDTFEQYFKDRFKLIDQDYLAYDHFRKVSLRGVEKSYLLKWDEEIKPYQKEFTAKKASVTKPYLEKVGQYLPNDETAFKELLHNSYEMIDYLLGEDGFVHRFKECYQLKKKALHVLDFNDLEQYTIKLLQPHLHISALLYHKLREIMIDEYQDTNQIQETIIGLIKDYEMPSVVSFMVGDMKQSIYRFRQADPQLFKEKYDTYALTDKEAKISKTRRIDLRYNYRSNKIVLDSVNYIFNQIMDSQVGGLEYLHDTSSHLNYDYLRKERCQTLEELPLKTKVTDQYYEQENRFDSEVLLVNGNNTGILKDSEYEAHMVAMRICELIETGTVNDYSGQPRKVEYKDIVILMRSTGLFLTFKKVFDLYNIPNHIVLSQGYLNAVEINAVITMLKAILNHYDDVSLLSMLRGPYLFSHVSEEIIASIRLQGKKQALYEQLQSNKEIPVIHDFLETLAILKKSSKTKSPSEFLEEVLDLSGYRLFVSQLINGKQRVANLNLLVEEFKQRESELDIKSIVEIYENMMDNQSASSPAQMISSTDNVVQFMTIHKSKGLEFPIVFVCNMDKGFNKQDSTKRIIIDKQLGIAINPRYKETINTQVNKWLDQLVEIDNPYRKLLASRQTEEAINEEMRIFYVALTRASQKLIMSGVGSLKQLETWQKKILINESKNIYDYKKNKSILMYYNIRKSNSYLDWVGLSIMRHPQIIQQWKQKEEFEVIQKQFKAIEKLGSIKRCLFDNTKASKFTLDYFDYEMLDEKIENLKRPKVVMDKEQSIEYRTLKPVSTIEKVTSVTKIQAKQSSVVYEATPRDYSDKTLTPAQIGTLVHAFFEYLPLDGTPVRDVIDSLYEKGLYNEDEKDILINYQDKIENFFKSDCFNCMIEADTLYRERPFSLLEEDTHQIVHGIFDVLCFKDQSITIIDYKTDRVTKNTAHHILVENHRVQMEYYKLILKRMYPNYEVKAMVYYLEIGSSVTI